jgi:hypothetical protein
MRIDGVRAALGRLSADAVRRRCPLKLSADAAGYPAAFCIQEPIC